MTRSVLELKAELFGIFQTLAMLDHSVKIGNIPVGFYRTKYLNLASEIETLLLEFHEKNMDYLDVLGGFDLDEDFNIILRNIKELQISTYNHESDTIEQHPLMFAEKISSITGKFITIIDYFQVIDFVEVDFLKQLVHELLILMEGIEILRPIFRDVVQIERDIIAQSNQNTIHPSLTEYFGERFYKAYASFQEMIKE